MRMTKKRTMSIGGATYDLFVRVPHEVLKSHADTTVFALPLGEKIPVQEVQETCGGGACNTSVGLARLGCDAYFGGIIADDEWGQRLLRNFEHEGVNTSCATIVEGEVSSFSIILSASGGERVILYESGTNEHLHDSTFNREEASRMDWVYLNHIQTQSCVIQDDLVTILALGKAPKLTWNPGGCQIEAGIEPQNNRNLLEHTDLLLLNAEEARRFTHSSTTLIALHTLATLVRGAVCITDGGRGVLAADHHHLYRCPVLPDTTVLDTTGAGDAFGTGATWALLQGMSLPDALRAGTINAAGVVSTIGAQAGLRRDIDMRDRLVSTDLAVETSPL